MSEFKGRSFGIQISSGTTFVEVVQRADLGNSDNLVRRGRLHRAWPGTILIYGTRRSVYNH
jgi:hypothetical protein